MLGYLIFFLLLLIITTGKLSPKRKIISTCILLISFSGIRYGIGYDYYMYYDLVVKYGETGVRQVEPIPSFFLWLASQSSPYIFFLLSSTFIYIPFIYGIKSINIPFSNRAFAIMTFFFVGFPYFYFSSFGMIRQFMAYSMIFLAITRFYKNYPITILLIGIGYLCHQSALAALLILFPWERINLKSIWIGLFSSIILGEFLIKFILSLQINIPAFQLLQIYVSLEDLYKGGGKIQYLIYLYAILSLIKYHKLTKLNHRNKYYIALTCIGAFFQATLGISPHLATRICTFFFLAAIPYFPELMQCYRIKISWIIIGCISLFSMYVYIQHKTTLGERPEDPKGYTNSYPYRTILNQILK